MKTEPDIRKRPILFLDISLRTYGRLDRAVQDRRWRERQDRSGPVLVEELLEWTPEELLQIRMFGRGCLEDVQKRLGEHGLRLAVDGVKGAARIAELEAQNERLRTALAYYADRDNYDEEGAPTFRFRYRGTDQDGRETQGSAGILDYGYHAREALGTPDEEDDFAAMLGFRNVVRVEEGAR